MHASGGRLAQRDHHVGLPQTVRDGPANQRLVVDRLGQAAVVHVIGVQNKEPIDGHRPEAGAHKCETAFGGHDDDLRAPRGADQAQAPMGKSPMAAECLDNGAMTLRAEGAGQQQRGDIRAAAVVHVGKPEVHEVRGLTERV